MRLYSIVYKIRRTEMQQIILGSAGFLLYFIYDINSVRKQNRLLQKFFAAGTILVVLSLFMEQMCIRDSGYDGDMPTDKQMQVIGNGLLEYWGVSDGFKEALASTMENMFGVKAKD